MPTLLKRGEIAARLDRQAQIAGEYRSATSACGIHSANSPAQKAAATDSARRSPTSFGRQAAELHQQVKLAHALAAEFLQQCSLQAGVAFGQWGHHRARGRADFGVFKRGGAAYMMAIGNAVQADQFSCHVKRADPLLPVRRAQAGFQGAAANLEETGKGFTGPVHSPALILRRLNMRLSMQSTRAFAGSPGMHHARRWHRAMRLGKVRLHGCRGGERGRGGGRFDASAVRGDQHDGSIVFSRGPNQLDLAQGMNHPGERFPRRGRFSARESSPQACQTP